MIEKMPIVKQQDLWSCSNAVAGSLIRHFGFPKKEIKQIVSRMVATPIDGSDPRAVEGFYRSLNLGVVSGNMTWDMLRFFGKKQIPVILLVNFSGTGHYIISLGVKRNRLFYHDPLESEIRSMDRDELDSFWVDWDNRYHVHYKNFGIAVFKENI